MQVGSNLLAVWLPVLTPNRDSVAGSANQVLAFGALMIVLWVLCAVGFNTAQFGDNIEQFNWSQSLEWGYRKHPPLPTWLLGGVIRCFGFSVYWAYALAGLCLLGTLWFTWRIACEVLGPTAAAAAVLLWGLNLTFSYRAQLYNHNTVLVLCVAATVWWAMRATRPSTPACHRWGWWLATGLAAGAALLSKYQALVPLAGLLLALMAAGRMRRWSAWGGLLLALVTLSLVLAPHVVWVVRHDYSTLRYASEAVESAGLTQQFGFAASFWANQVRLWSVALAVMGLCWWLDSRGASRSHTPCSPPLKKPWVWGLMGAGLLVLMLMALLAGVSLRNHWGVQALQFFSLWLAGWWGARRLIALDWLMGLALLAHGLGWVIYAVEHQNASRLMAERRIDTLYPAERLAHVAATHWAAHTRCPLRWVAGHPFPAGLISLYAQGLRPLVFDSEAATPWVTALDLHTAGALYVWEPEGSHPQGLVNIVAFELLPGHPEKTLQMGLLMPASPCP
jgi:4-amino-4-deoxy-L-arabinose transferase-like glycosyltransferase